MKYLIITPCLTIFLCVLTISSSLHKKDTDTISLANKLRHDTVLIFVETEKGIVQGSGVIIKTNENDYVLTAAHCVQIPKVAGKEVLVVIPEYKWGALQGKREYKCEIVAFSKRNEDFSTGHDLALLKLKNRIRCEWLKFSDAKVGEQVFACGNVQGRENIGSFTSGYLSGINRRDDMGEIWDKLNEYHETGFDEFSFAGVNHGSSGCGIYNKSGDIVGIVQMMGSPTTVYGAPTRFIKAFLLEFGYYNEFHESGVIE